MRYKIFPGYIAINFIRGFEHPHVYDCIDSMHVKFTLFDNRVKLFPSATLFRVTMQL